MPDKQADLVPAVRKPAPPADRDETRIAGILELAVQKNLPVESLEKLVALQERILDRNAASEFNAALAAFQYKCPPIIRASTAEIISLKGTRFSYRHAELDEIARTVGPLLHGNGFSYSWDSSVDGGTLSCTCTLRHMNGHAERASFSCPTESRAGMTEAQKVAAALTFAKRQTLTSVLGLSMCDPDTDGMSPEYAEEAEKITEEQAANIEALLSECPPGTKGRMMDAYEIGQLSELPAAKYEQAIKKLEAGRKAT